MTGSADSLEDFFSTSPEMLFVATEGGALERWSDLLEERLGPGLIRGGQVSELVHPEDRGAFTEAWAKIAGSREPIRTEVKGARAEAAAQRLELTLRHASGRGKVYGSLREVKKGTLTPQEIFDLQEHARILKALAQNIEVCIWACDERGIFTHHFGKGLTAAGLTQHQFVGMNLFDIYGHDTKNMEDTRRALAGELVHNYGEHHGIIWESWLVPSHATEEGAARLLGFTLDVTAAKSAERELRTKLELIEKQQQVIRDLSTPIIQVWDGVLVLPMVGVVDSARTSDVMQQLLDAVVRSSARFAILDLTGVEMVDTKVANHLLGLVNAIRLLGAEGIVSGIRPNVAQTVVALGLDLSSIVTHANLRAALIYCIRRMGAPA